MKREKEEKNDIAKLQSWSLAFIKGRDDSSKISWVAKKDGYCYGVLLNTSRELIFSERDKDSQSLKMQTCSSVEELLSLVEAEGLMSVPLLSIFYQVTITLEGKPEQICAKW